MEWLDKVALFFGENGQQILNYLLIIGGTIFGSFATWKGSNIIINLIKFAMKKHDDKVRENQKQEFSSIFKDAIKEEFNEQVNCFKNAINEAKAEEQKKKQKLYEDIFNEKVETIEVEEEKENDAEIGVVNEETTEIEQIPEEEVKTEIKDEQRTENTKKQIDIL